MIIGTPKEIKEDETRVAMTPYWAKKLVESGHEVLIQKGAGVLSGFCDDQYIEAGARLVDTLEDVYEQAEFVTKVKELMPREFDLIRENQLLMTWLHLAEDHDKPMTQALMDRKTIALSMELIVLDDGSRPTMKPMSEIAGSLGMLESVKYCQTINGGTGIFLKKVKGLPTPKVVIVGGGNAGSAAAQVALGLGLRTTIIEEDYDRLEWLKYALPGAEILLSEEGLIEREALDCDVFVNCVYPSPEPGERKYILKRETIRKMTNCSLIMDIAGAKTIETGKYTTLSEPVYVEEGVLHYGVDNMPSLIPKTATEALLMITGPYIMAIAEKGLKKAAEDDASIRRCISTVGGKLVHEEIAINQELPYTELDLDMLP